MIWIKGQRRRATDTGAMELTVSRHVPSAAQIAAAPHRLLFLVGALNVLAAMGWWAWWLASAAHGASPAATVVHAGWAHAFVMQYQVLPPFIFGFLLTVFPRWMGLPELTRWHYIPVGLGLVTGQAAFLAGLVTDSLLLVQLGVFNTLAGWLTGLAILLALLVKDALKTWHAVSCAMGLVMGALGLIAFVAYLLLGDARWLFASFKIGTFGLLLPIYYTVAHRMFPFFAGNVVPGYAAWRPMWLLVPFWVAAFAHLCLELSHAYACLWLVDLPWLALVLGWLWKVWPRGRAPALLRVLFLGCAWLPIALALFAGQSFWFSTSGQFALGRAPAHALFVGFFGSLLVAMVTRVTQGHSGRALELGRVAAFAFVAIQLVSVTRIVAELVPNAPWWQFAAAVGWLVAFLPWVIRSAWIYATPRIDGRPG